MDVDNFPNFRRAFNSVVRMNFRVPIFVICFLEFVWYTFSIGASWFEIGKIYYDWSMRLQDTIKISNIAWLSIGILGPTLSLIATFALFYVAFTDGRCKPLIFFYMAKNTITIILEITFFGSYILDLANRNAETAQGPLAILMFIFCGIFTPLFFSLVSYKYYRFIAKRNDVANMLYEAFEDLTKKMNAIDKEARKEATLRKRKGRKVKKI